MRAWKAVLVVSVAVASVAAACGPLDRVYTVQDGGAARADAETVPADASKDGCAPGTGSQCYTCGREKCAADMGACLCDANCLAALNKFFACRTNCAVNVLTCKRDCLASARSGSDLMNPLLDCISKPETCKVVCGLID